MNVVAPPARPRRDRHLQRALLRPLGHLVPEPIEGLFLAVLLGVFAELDGEFFRRCFDDEVLGNPFRGIRGGNGENDQS